MNRIKNKIYFCTYISKKIEGELKKKSGMSYLK